MVQGWIAVDYGMGWNVFRDDRTRSNQCILANGASAYDGGICSDARSALNERGCKIFCSVSRDGTARGEHVGEHSRWSAKDIILQSDPFVNRHVVLNLDVVSYFDSGPNYDVLTDTALFSNLSASEKMAEVPYVTLIADLNAIVYVRRFVNEEVGA